MAPTWTSKQKLNWHYNDHHWQFYRGANRALVQTVFVVAVTERFADKQVCWKPCSSLTRRFTDSISLTCRRFADKTFCDKTFRWQDNSLTPRFADKTLRWHDDSLTRHFVTTRQKNALWTHVAILSSCQWIMFSANHLVRETSCQRTGLSAKRREAL